MSEQSKTYMSRRYTNDETFKEKMKNYSKTRRENRTPDEKEKYNQYMRDYRRQNNMLSKKCRLCNKKVGRGRIETCCSKCSNIISIYHSIPIEDI